MDNSANFAFALAAVSLLLPAGWSIFLQHAPNVQTWQQISTGWIGKVARFFYFVGIPYVAVITGAITPLLLGLTGTEYFALVNRNVAAPPAVQIQQAATLTLLDWLVNSSMALVAGFFALFLFWAIWSGLKRVGASFTLTQPSVLGAAYYALHWAFYRAIFWSVTGDLYLASVLGILIVMFEWGVRLWLKNGWQRSQPQFLVNSIVLLLTATIFYYSPNLWLLFPFHLAMTAIAGQGIAAGTSRLSALQTQG